jgi:NADPH:quinone reductase-like Zn-dependent oxidoreductase
LVSLTAWQALFEAGELAQGQTVLIHGAAGGVGHVAVQLAKWRGARVIATASDRNAHFLRQLGVDTHIDYRTTRFEDVARDVDVVLDSFGGEIQERSWPVLRKGGLLVTIRSSAGIAEKAAHHGVRARHVLVRPEPKHFSSIDELVVSGKLRPVVSAVYPLAEARDAQEQIELGHTRGKVVLRVGMNDS